MADRSGRRTSSFHGAVAPRHLLARAAIAAAAVAALGGLGALGCENKMAPEECDKLRAEAFQTLNKAHHCGEDKDCRQSAWPGCQKPLNNKDYDAIKPLEDRYKAGKCEEPKIECKDPPEVYCKQGLCVHREKGRDENAPAPSDEIKLE